MITKDKVFESKQQFNHFKDKKFRPTQLKALQFLAKSQSKISLLQLPAGGGKTLIGNIAGSCYGRYTYLVSTIQLQDQLEIEFPEVNLLKGRANYPCNHFLRVHNMLDEDITQYTDTDIKFNVRYCDSCVHGKSFKCKFKLTKKDIEKLRFNDKCLYDIAKFEAHTSDKRILNYAYFLAATNYVNSFTDNDIIICDEADVLSNDTLINFIKLELNSLFLNEIDVKPPAKKTFGSDKLIKYWKSWFQDTLIPEMENKSLTIGEELETFDLTRNGMVTVSSLDAYKRLESKHRRINNQIKNAKTLVDNIDETWICDITSVPDEYKNKRIQHKEKQIKDLERKGMWSPDATSINTKINALREDLIILKKSNEIQSYSFKPTWLTKPLSDAFFFNYGKKFILMSATFPPLEVLCSQLGREAEDFDFYEAKDSYPKENRRVFLNTVTKVSHKTIHNDIELLTRQIAKDCMDNENANVKGLIHTVSYFLNNQLFYNLSNIPELEDRLITHNSKTKQHKLNVFIGSDKPLIMLSPVMTRGVDLPDDKCRFIMLAKAPFLSLGDKLTSTRLNSSAVGKVWYKSIVAQEVVQSVGRGNRHWDDWCKIYVYDGHIEDMIFGYRNLFPEYFIEACEV